MTKQKRELKNDKLFEADNAYTQLEADIEKMKRDQDKNMERRLHQLTKQLRADTDHYKRTL